MSREMETSHAACIAALYSTSLLDSGSVQEKMRPAPPPPHPHPHPPALFEKALHVHGLRRIRVSRLSCGYGAGVHVTCNVAVWLVVRTRGHRDLDVHPHVEARLQRDMRRGQAAAVRMLSWSHRQQARTFCSSMHEKMKMPESLFCTRSLLMDADTVREIPA